MPTLANARRIGSDVETRAAAVFALHRIGTPAAREAVRAALAKAPAYGQAELEALTQSNAHMAQVAIELAALRRQEGNGGLAAELSRLEVDIRRHVEVVSAAMAQGAQRWQLKV